MSYRRDPPLSVAAEKPEPMVRRAFLFVVAAAACSWALAPVSAPAAGANPGAFIADLSANLWALSRIPAADRRLAELSDLLRNAVDFEALGRFVAGRYWRALTAAQQAEFLELFQDYAVLTLNDRLSELLASQPRVTGSRPDPAYADGAIVSSEIRNDPTAPASTIEWRLTDRGMVWDIIINRLSVAIEGRDQTAKIIERNGGQAQAILPVLRQLIAGRRPVPPVSPVLSPALPHTR
jgi:phospholipid transport system substrate-binding protein